jgi:hypothetical protein
MTGPRFTIQCNINQLTPAAVDQLRTTRTTTGPLPLQVAIGGEPAVAGHIVGWSIVGSLLALTVATARDDDSPD